VGVGDHIKKGGGLGGDIPQKISEASGPSGSEKISVTGKNGVQENIGSPRSSYGLRNETAISY